MSERLIGIDKEGMKLFGGLRYCSGYERSGLFTVRIKNQKVKCEPTSLYSMLKNGHSDWSKYSALVLGRVEMYDGEWEQINPILKKLREDGIEIPPTLCAVMESGEIAQKLYRDEKLNEYDAITIMPGAISGIVSVYHKGSIADLLLNGNLPNEKQLFNVCDPILRNYRDRNGRLFSN